MTSALNWSGERQRLSRQRGEGGRSKPPEIKRPDHTHEELMRILAAKAFLRDYEGDDKPFLVKMRRVPFLSVRQIDAILRIRDEMAGA